MFNRTSLSNESQLSARGLAVHEPQQEENLYDTFLEMRDHRFDPFAQGVEVPSGSGRKEPIAIRRAVLCRSRSLYGPAVRVPKATFLPRSNTQRACPALAMESGSRVTQSEPLESPCTCDPSRCPFWRSGVRDSLTTTIEKSARIAAHNPWRYLVVAINGNLLAIARLTHKRFEASLTIG